MGGWVLDVCGSLNFLLSFLGFLSVTAVISYQHCLQFALSWWWFVCFRQQRCILLFWSWNLK